VADPSDDASERIPHSDRRLTEEEWRERIRHDWKAEIVGDLWEQSVRWLREKWPNPPPQCPFCGTSSWDVGDRLVEQRTWATTAVQPMLAVSCTNCAYTVHINAEKAGLVRKLDTETEPDA
jgi:hypothetical protein